jgi:putative membrane protein
MKKILIPFALLFVLACNTSPKQEDSVEVAEEKNEQKTDTMQRPGQMENDNEFIVKAASGGLMEVQLGEMAAKQATTTAVKEFARMMVTDHAKVNEELKALAATKNITIPTTPGEDHMDHINKMRDKTGTNFDKDYMNLMVDDHKDDVDDFEKAARDSKDPDVKAFAAKYAPALRGHLEKAKSVKDMLK